MIKINKTTETLGIMDPEVLYSKELSLTAKGIYATIMNCNGCKTNVDELYNCSTDSREVVNIAIKELLEKDLIQFVQ